MGAILVEEEEEDRDAADEATLQPEKDECEMKMDERMDRYLQSRGRE